MSTINNNFIAGNPSEASQNADLSEMDSVITDVNHATSVYRLKSKVHFTLNILQLFIRRTSSLEMVPIATRSMLAFISKLQAIPVSGKLNMYSDDVWPKLSL